MDDRGLPEQTRVTIECTDGEVFVMVFGDESSYLDVMNAARKTWFDTGLMNSLTFESVAGILIDPPLMEDHER